MNTNAVGKFSKYDPDNEITFQYWVLFSILMIHLTSYLKRY